MTTELRTVDLDPNLLDAARDTLPDVISKLSPFVSSEPVSPNDLAALDGLIAGVSMINPRGVVQTAPEDTEDEGFELPSTDRLELCLDSDYNGGASFDELRKEILAATLKEYENSCSGEPTSYWRLIISFPGAINQVSYTNDDEQSFVIAEVDIASPEGGGRTIFPDCNVSVGPNQAVIYDSTTLLYNSVCTSAREPLSPRVTLMLILSAHGDPSDAAAEEESVADDELHSSGI